MNPYILTMFKVIFFLQGTVSSSKQQSLSKPRKALSIVYKIRCYSESYFQRKTRNELVGVTLIYPFMLRGLFYYNSLDQSISNRRGSG